MADIDSLFSILSQSAESQAVAAIASSVRDDPDARLNRINVFDFARRHALEDQTAIAAFLHASRLGLFDMSWNVLCPGCGGVLDNGDSLQDVDQEQYNCALCAAGYTPTLDEMVEVTFTVNPTVRKIAAHNPETLPFAEYYRQMFWGSGIDLPDDFQPLMDEITIEAIEIAAGEKAVLSVDLPEGFVILFDPVTHSAHFLDVKGEPATERQNLSVVFNRLHTPTSTQDMRPGRLRISLENRADTRVLPALWIAAEPLHKLLGQRRPFLTAKLLLTNQVFRDMYRTDTMSVDQRLKITSLTFLFTDLKASTALYDRVGDLVAYDLVRAHFRRLYEIVADETGAVVKTIGDAVMATFPSPDRAMAAALRMRHAMDDLNREKHREDLILKIGIHEGPCLAVTLNDRQDYFGQTVNIASRVQALADSHEIFVTGAVLDDKRTSGVLAKAGLAPTARRQFLRGISDEFTVYAVS